MKKGDEIAERIERVFSAIANNPEITVKELEDLLNISKKQIGYIVTEAPGMENGLLTRNTING